jgi:hypothetical protein
MAAVYDLRYGPFPLTTKGIDGNKVPAKIGCYALGALNKAGNGIVVLRVGRSDGNVNGRLKQYIGASGFEECTHFLFDVFATPEDAFDVECLLFHDFEPILNENHPGRPAGSDRCCPLDDCTGG